MKHLYLPGIILLVLLSTAISAQDNNDTINKGNKKEKPIPLEPYHWNVIKFNPTPMLLWDMSNITFSYESLIKKDQSVMLQVGFLAFPNLLDDTLINLVAIYDRERKGLNLSFDYRYYPFSRNRRPAPDGLYIGGYISYYGIKAMNKFDILHTSIEQNGALDAKASLLNFGFEMGYQFIFWKRFSLDLLLFGPSFSFISTSINISGELDQEQVDDLNQELVDKLLKRFPALETVFSDDGHTFKNQRSRFSPLLRYSVAFGFHF